jgi:hypothetical protein
LKEDLEMVFMTRGFHEKDERKAGEAAANKDHARGRRR